MSCATGREGSEVMQDCLVVLFSDGKHPPAGDSVTARSLDGDPSIGRSLPEIRACQEKLEMGKVGVRKV